MIVFPDTGAATPAPRRYADIGITPRMPITGLCRVPVATL